MGGENLRKLAAGDLLGPHAIAFGDYFDPRVLFEDGLGRGGTRRVDRRARNTRDDDNIALSAELVDEPLRGLTPGGVLVDSGVVSAGFGDDRVIGKNEDALVASALHHLVQGSGRDRIDDD